VLLSRKLHKIVQHVNTEAAFKPDFLAA